MARKYRPRKLYKFWLYHDREEDSRLMDFIQYCKSTRQFTRVLRDGIRLIWSLREGNTAILFELFPHLERQFNPDSEMLIAEFREMLLQHRDTPQPQHATIEEGDKSAEGGRKLLSAAKIDLPLLDDDDSDTIVLTKKVGVMNGSNLLAGVLGTMG